MSFCYQVDNGKKVRLFVDNPGQVLGTVMQYS